MRPPKNHRWQGQSQSPLKLTAGAAGNEGWLRGPLFKRDIVGSKRGLAPFQLEIFCRPSNFMFKANLRLPSLSSSSGPTFSMGKQYRSGVSLAHLQLDYANPNQGRGGGRGKGRGRGRGGGGGNRNNWDDRSSYKEIEKKNEQFERYYNELNLVEGDERTEFWTALRRELPNSFRFAGSKG
jgi:hypothetical protein